MTRTLQRAWVFGVLASACASYATPDVDARDVVAPADAVIDGSDLADVPDDAAILDVGPDPGAADAAPDGPDARVEGRWTERPWALSGDLRAAWGRGFDDVLAVGDGGAVVRFNGRWAARLAVDCASDLLDVDGAPGVVAVVGAEGTLLASVDGRSFAPVATGVTTALRGVAAWSADELLAVGDGGTIVQVKDGHPELQASNTTADLLGAWTGPDGEALALDEAGGVLRRLNGVWLRTQVAHGPIALQAAAGPDALHVLVAGAQGFLGAFDGLAWTSLLSNDASGRDLDALRVLPDGEAWAAGAGGVLLRRAAGTGVGAAFALEEVLGPTLADAVFHGLVVERSGGTVRGLLAGQGAALVVNAGDGWRDASTAPGQTLRDAVVLPDGRVAAVGESGLVGVLSGDRWSALPLDETRDLDGVALDADGSTLWIGAPGALLRVDVASSTTTETAIATPGRVRAVDDGVFVGDAGLLGRVAKDGTVRLLAVPEGVGRLYAVAVCDGTVWAAGDGGVLLTVKADVVGAMSIETFETLRAVTCTDNGIVAAGDNGVVVEADAGAGRVVRREAGVLWQAAAWSDGEAWLAGLDGRVLRGSADAGWTSSDLPVPLGVHALVATNDGRVVALGVNGRAFVWGAP